ncbi:MAG: YitT family protein [Clostridia bacterium]|nr:YitT family protein [Clostridia bacterium]MBR3865944.1 YitT family protein [Clostridia bacterium]
MKRIKNYAEILTIMALAACSALNYAIFIFPNRFAPAGIDGICTMLQDVSGVNIGYFSLIVNIPLLIAAFIKLDRNYAVKNTAFILSFSVASALLEKIDLSDIYFHTQSGTSIVLAPIAAGVIRGIIYAFTLKLNGASGGIDIIAAIIRKKAPHFSLMNIIFALNMCVSLSSCFVYGNYLEPAICGILYFYITTQTSSHIQLSMKENSKIEIITKNAEGLCADITEELHLSATVLDSRGAHLGNAAKMVVCIAEKKHIPPIKEMLKKYPDSIYFVSSVKESNTHSY